jgi:hypothetical protein
VLVLRELEGLPCTEIARIVGATHVTVRWRLHRGRKLFQEEWERRERLAEKGLRPGGDDGEGGEGGGAGAPESESGANGEQGTFVLPPEPPGHRTPEGDPRKRSR